MPPISWVYTLFYVVPAVLLALSVHEFAHAWVAVKQGDHSKETARRLTLNPLVHLDAVWAILLLFTRLWLKPLESFDRFGRGRRALVSIALAGPLANFALAIVFRIGARVLPPLFPGSVAYPLADFMTINVQYNLLFAAVNLLPIPPLDGARALSGLLPPKQALWLARMETTGLIILVLLVVSGFLYAVTSPLLVAMRAVLNLI